jgi:tetratricopeptide (TPR) repeat protein
MGKVFFSITLLMLYFSSFSQDFIETILQEETSNEAKINQLLELTADTEFKKINVDSVLTTLSNEGSALDPRYILLSSKLYLINRELTKSIRELEKVNLNTFSNLKEKCEWYFISGRLAVLKQPDSSLSYLLKSYDLAVEVKDLDLQYRSLRYLGAESARNSNYIQAIDFYEKARQLGVQSGDVQKIIDYEISAGKVSKYTEDFQRLVEINEALLANYTIEEIGFKKKIIYNNLAVGYAETDTYLKSIEYQIKTLELSDSGDLVYNVTLMNLGTCILDSYEAKKVSMDTLIVFLNQVQFCQNYLGLNRTIKNKTELFDLVKKLIDISIVFLDKDPFQSFQPYSYLTLGRLQLINEEYSQAEQSLLKANELSLKVNDQGLIKEISSILAKLYSQTKNYELAYKWKEKSTFIGDSINLTKQQTKIGYLLAKKEYENEQFLDSLKQAQQIQINQVEANRKEKTRVIINVFILVVVLFLLLFFYLFYRKTKLESEHKLIRLEQNLLRTQMNPHFIFNSLTTIGGFVLKNKIDVSYNYISKFAKLMRLILDSSRKEFISLSEEVEIVTSFLVLHKLNSKNILNYSVNYDEGLLDEDIKVPPMLLQPFIENAIKYGYNSEKEEINIVIDFFLNEDILICKVKDDGKGFLNNSIPDSKTSHAIKITQERIANIKKQSKKLISLKIINQKKLEDNSTGVLVELTIQV